MTITISLTGLASQAQPETRALAYLDVNYNSTLYAWQIYIPNSVTDLAEYLQLSAGVIQSQIDAKEAEWAALEPKTKTITNPITNEQTTVPIPKEEIVKPDIPDYFASRRSAYPPLGDQLDAVWKGPNHSDYVTMQEKIQAVKSQYPKPV